MTCSRTWRSRLFHLMISLIAVSTYSGHVCASEPPGEAIEERALPSLPEIDAPTREEIDEAIGRGVRFLLEDQNEDGSWGSATRTKGLNIYAPVPGSHQAFRAATTAMAIDALLESGASDAAVSEAIGAGEAWLLEHLPHVRRATPDAIYNVWTHCYAIPPLIALRHDDVRPENNEELDKLVELQIDLLQRYASVNGGWGYYDFDYGTKVPGGSSISFTTAAIMLSLKTAREHGYAVPQPMVEKALASIRRQQKNDFSYLYGEYLKMVPVMGINRPGGSLGRSQVCNLALRQWGDEEITDAVLKEWLARLVLRNGWLDIGRKRPIPHEAWFQVAGYFYYFGHYYAARCIEALPEQDQTLFAPQLARLILDRQEKNGSWWDFPFYDYHEPYGTAFALMTLVRCR